MIFRKSNISRIGLDKPLTHWMLHIPFLMRWLCRKKFGSFGKNSDFRPGAYAVNCQNIYIGDNVNIRPNTMLFADPSDNGCIEIYDNVLMGAGVHIYCNNHIYDNKYIPVCEQGYKDIKNVVLANGCWIGANSIILPGVTVGVNSVVGAGSIVTKSVPCGAVVAGNPARIIK